MKKIVPVLLASLFVFLLAACALRGENPSAAQSATGYMPTPSSTEAPSPAASPEPAADEFVRIADYIPYVFVDLKYATDDNFTGQTIYTVQDAYLGYGTVQKLVSATDGLRGQGYRVWSSGTRSGRLRRSGSYGRPARTQHMCPIRTRATRRTAGATRST